MMDDTENKIITALVVILAVFVVAAIIGLFIQLKQDKRKLDIADKFVERITASDSTRAHILFQDIWENVNEEDL